MFIMNQLSQGSPMENHGKPVPPGAPWDPHGTPRISDLDEPLEDFGSAGRRVPKPTAGYISWPAQVIGYVTKLAYLQL